MNRWNRFLPVIGGAIAGGAIALAVSGGGTTHSTTTVIQPNRGAALPTSFSSTKGMSINEIYKADSPGVVDILVTSTTNNGVLGAQQSQGEGAGVVYDKNGDIVTDQHVVANATQVTVRFQDGRKVPATVLGTDASTDVGVIHVNVPSSELHPISFANSNEAQVGDPVVAIGSPFSLPETTTTGIVSQTGRSIQAPNQYTISGAIQTDAAINPGNSGGPLLDAGGQVLGLNDQIDTNNTTTGGQGSSSGVGFAVPSNTVARVANAIISGKTVRHAYLGVELSGSSYGGAQVTTVDGTPAQRAGIQPGDLITAIDGKTVRHAYLGVELSGSSYGGAQVTTVDGTPAQRAGIKPGDLITAIDGKPVTNTDQFIATIDQYSPGNTVTLTVKRGGSTKQINVKLGTRPSQAPGAQQVP